MRRRLYFMLPHVHSAKQVVDDLLLARIEARHIHVLAPRDAPIGDLPEATVFQKTDLVHGAQIGALIGGLLGAVAGALLVTFPPGKMHLQLVTVLIAALLGAVFGLWVASLAGATVPNSRLKQFRAWIDQGKLLLMVDVPFSEQARIVEIVKRRPRKRCPAAANRRFQRSRELAVAYRPRRGTQRTQGEIDKFGRVAN